MLLYGAVSSDRSLRLAAASLNGNVANAGQAEGCLRVGHEIEFWLGARNVWDELDPQTFTGDREGAVGNTFQSGDHRLCSRGRTKMISESLWKPES